MKFSLFAIAALAAATSSSCMVAATAAASRKRKIAKKVTNGPNNGPNGGPPGPPPPGGLIPIGDYCTTPDDCVIPVGLDHGVCLGGNEWLVACQSGQPGSWCKQTSDCVVQNNLDPPHAVCGGPNQESQGGFKNKLYKCQR